MRNSIRGNLLWLVLFVSIPLVAATLLAIRSLVNELERAQAQTLLSTTRALAAAVSAELDKYAAVGGSLATSVLFERREFEEFHRRATAALKPFPGCWVVVADQSGQQIVNTLRPFGGELPKIRAMEFHQRAMTARTPVVSDIIKEPLDDRLVVGIYVPAVVDAVSVFDIIVIIDPHVFGRILADQQLPPGWVTGIGDRNGRFVGRSIDNERFLGEPISEGWRSASLTGIEGTFDNISKEGVPLHSAFKNVASAGWTVSVGASQDVLRASARSSVWRVGLISVSLIGISLLLAWLAARRITRSMESLQDASTALLENRADTVRRTGLEEVDHAIAAFESAAASIMDRQRRHGLLVNELNHRVKNTLTVVQSIAHLGQQNATSLADFGVTFGKRIGSLAKTHDLLTSHSWDTVQLHDLVSNELDAYRADRGNQVILRGPPVMLDAKQAIALSMMVHELTTNAAKYGALSRAEGQLTVAWREQDDGKIRLEWIETNGPPVVQPARLNFGSKLIAGLAADLGAEITSEFNPAGLRFVILIPLSGSSGPPSAAASDF